MTLAPTRPRFLAPRRPCSRSRAPVFVPTRPDAPPAPSPLPPRPAPTPAARALPRRRRAPRAEISRQPSPASPCEAA
ncbi:MAG: hypothetical protein VYD87_03425, partial [Pseudomonadota bacterium]|nr:hypothetical protein [Pseudomonadota bacterium]